MTHVLLIDNYDSFSYNLVQAFRMLGAQVTVRRNDAASPKALMALAPTHLVLSPGPGKPEDAGCCKRLILEALGRLPILGVCLGHQCLVEALGGKITRGPEGMHGKTSSLIHDGTGLFRKLPLGMKVGRYHSLVAAKEHIPRDLRVTAQTLEGDIMAVEHATVQATGVQFHPESILTPQGPELLQNFLTQTGGLR